LSISERKSNTYFEGLDCKQGKGSESRIFFSTVEKSTWGEGTRMDVLREGESNREQEGGGEVTDEL